MAGGAEQHGGMTVMAAAMHFTGMNRGVLEGVQLIHRQRVHIGA